MVYNTDRFREGYEDNNIGLGSPLSKNRLLILAEDFNKYGWVNLGKVLTNSEVDLLKEIIDRRRSDSRVISDPEYDYTRKVSSMRMFEYHKTFLELLNKEPLIGFVEEILGDDCHLIAQNALYTRNGEGIVTWHIDDSLFFPFELSRYEKIPCYSLNVMISLTDVDSIEYGPTQVVSKSHYSGRKPPTQAENPHYEDNEVTTIYAKPGDVYILNSQLWHRGSQNNSDRNRYLVTMTYGKRFISQRFYPFLNYQIPKHVLECATEQQLRILGRHTKGPYG